MTTRRKPVKPLDEKLLRLDESAAEGWVLPGRRCRECETVFHPLRERCPRCGSDRLEELELAKTGAIQAFARVHQSGPDSRVAVPYYVGLIKIDSGPVIEAVSATGVESRSLRAGQRVKLVLEALGSDEDGAELVVYRFSIDGSGEV